MLNSNKRVYYNQTATERRAFNSTPADITDLNIEQRIKDFCDILKSEHVPLRYFCDIGKINY